MKRALHIGCSGYYYPYWRNRFYPAGMAPKNWLNYYSTVFDTVELNGTFYRTPKLADLQKYAAATGDDFRFSVKMSRYVTHILKLKESRQHIENFIGLMHDGLGNKLACVLFQLPPSFHFNEENMESVLANVPHHINNVIEFRHISWWNKEVENALKKANLTFCNVDFPGLDSFLIRTSNLFYFRFHGSPELFKSAYSTGQLKKFAQEIEQEKKAFVYFNNTFYEAGYTNARELAELTGTSRV